MKLTHGTPIETMLWLPGGAALLTAGGNEIKVWDIVGGGQLLHTFSAHQKVWTLVLGRGLSPFAHWAEFLGRPSHPLHWTVLARGS